MAVTERMFIDRQHHITAPRYGLLSVAETPTSVDQHWPNGIEYWTPAPPTVGETAIVCLGDDEEFDARIIPEGFPSGDGDAFQVYAAARCKSIGISEDELRARALASLTAGEQPHVESRLWRGAAPSIMSADTEVVGSTAVRLDGAIGRLEAWLYRNYASAGVIHLPRELAAVADHLSIVSADGVTMRTKLGTPVVFGNYPGTGPGASAAAPAAGSVWIAATGDVTVFRTPNEVLTDNGSAWFDSSTNTMTAIVVRDYLVTFDEVAGAQLVDLGDDLAALFAA